MVLPEEIPEFKGGKGMDLKYIVLYLIIFIGSLFAGIALGQNSVESKFQANLLDLNSSLVKIQQGLGVLFQGEVELARALQDVNAKIVLNEQALQSLDYLSKNCERTDTNNSFALNCRK